MSQQQAGNDHHHNKGNRTTHIPETRTGSDGTSKRNIQRKAHKAIAGVGGHGKKGMWDPTDDGSLAVVKPQRGDPNYVEDTAQLSLTAFKSQLTTILEEYFLSEDIQEAIRSI
jgi:hypothetical protein